MKLPRAAWLTIATLIVAMLTYILAAQNSDLMILLVPLVIVTRLSVTKAQKPALPQWAIAAATMGAICYAGLRVLDLGLDIVVFAEFVAMLAVLKTLEKWSARDDMQILLVAIFLVIASAIASNTLVVGVMLFLFIPLLGYTAMRLQIEGAIRFGERDEATSPYESDAAPTSPLLGTFLSALLLVSTIGVVAFVLLPRGVGEFELRGFDRPEMGRATGFRNGVTLGQGGLISSDPTVVMEVEIEDVESGSSLVALGKVIYLRGAVLPVYENYEWKPYNKSSDDLSLNDNEARLGHNFRSRTAIPDIRQIIQLKPEASDGGILFTMWQPQSLVFDTPQSGSLQSDSIRRTFVYPSSRTKLTRYEVYSSSRPVPVDTLSSRVPDPQFAENETIRTLAEELLAGVGIPASPSERPPAEDRRAAKVIEAWLATSNEFTYTLDIKDSELGRDPIEWFLTDAKTGHCEYFASAMAALCRSVGIDTRVVTGYIVSEVDTAKGVYIVRRADAHAWVEVETSPGLWETFDPTPDVTGLHAPSEAQYKFVRRILDAIDGFWLTQVVSFDAGSQMQLFGLDQDHSQMLAAEREILDTGKQALRIVVVLIAAGLTGLLVFRFYRKPRQDQVNHYGVLLPDSAQDALRALHRYWKAEGRERPSWQGLLAHAGDGHERELAAMLTSAAFGPLRWRDSDARRAAELLRELSDRQKQGVSSENAP